MAHSIASKQHHPAAIPLIPFPEGVPTFTARMGLYKTVPGHLPVQLLHRDYDIFWVVSGAAEWKLKDGTALRASRDQMVVLPPFVPAWVNETQAPMAFWYCHFEFRPPPQPLSPELQADFAGPGAAAHVPLFFTKREAPRVWSAYRDLSRLALGAGGEPWQVERGLITLVSELATFARSRRPDRARSRPFEALPLDARVAELCRRIDLDPIFPWLVSELAQSVGVTPGHLHTLCRRVLGKSIKRYIVEARLRHAMKLLKETKNGEPMSAYEVSEACGFSSQHFFSRQFKSYFNMSPIEYRNGSALT